MTPIDALIASIDADDALETAMDFERDLTRATDNIPDDFTAEERAALDLLIAAAAERVKLRRGAAGMEITE